MAWPVPRDRVLSAPQLVEEWDEVDPMEPGGGEREVRDALGGLRVEKGRSVLMGRKEEFERIGFGEKDGKGAWKAEPWYGTLHRVEKYDEEFIRQVRDMVWLRLTLQANETCIFRPMHRMTLRSCSYLVRMSLFRRTWTSVRRKLPRFVLIPLSSAAMFICSCSCHSP